MPSWSAEAKYRLLLSIITILDTKPPKWEEVSALMGPEYTAEAVRQQYQKIKRQSHVELAVTTDTAAESSKVDRPGKRKLNDSEERGDEENLSKKNKSSRSKQHTVNDEIQAEA